MLEIVGLSAEAPAVSERPIKPEIKIIEARDTYGKFVLEPLERGYGITIGNPVRRILLSSIVGTAVTWVKIDGVLHEYSTVPHVKEEVMELLLNVKKLRIRSVSGRSGKMRLEVFGEGMVSAGDIATSSDFEIVNPELHMATLDSPEAALSIELNVEQGKGYHPAALGENLPIGVLPVDAIFGPVRKVNYSIERTRVGQVTDYERLILELWTDGTKTPLECIKTAASLLVNHFFLFSSVGDPAETDGGGALSRTVPAELYQMSIEKLELSPRTLNCLKRAHISKVGEVLEHSDEELLRIRNFGDKSLAELHARLVERGFKLNGAETGAEPIAPGPVEEPAVPEEDE